MLFCPICNNILDISKTVPKIISNIDDKTPNEISSNTESDGLKTDIIENTLQKIIDNDDVTTGELKKLDIEKITQHDFYKKLSKTNKKKVDDKLLYIRKELDLAISAFYICNNCQYSKPIDQQTLITSRVNDDISNNYTNTEKFKNMVYNKALPVTRNYICKNKDCTSHKKHDMREAVFYRNGMQVWYTCKACKSYWKGE
jgi:hypothetical protein